ncbi:MAG: methyl-accepting chemotaxis protein [Burkholderiaceae bacterium]|nr:methyl-accepting chemotaxis protein [Burkholderiaceae bacterium]
MAERSFALRLRTGIAVLAAAPFAVALAGGAAWLLARDAQAASKFGAVGVALLAGAALLAVAGTVYGRRLAQSVSEPIARIQSTLEALSDGDLDARVRWAGRDEFAGLADALDRLLDDRVAGLNRTIRDSEELNTSVIEIMKAVGTIATTKDLSVRVPVTENVTGAIADALNLLTDEMARVLESVGRLANDVAQATFALRGQSDLAITAAAREQREVGMAASELSQAAQALVAVAQRAHQVDQSAARALVETGEAVRVVGVTIEGIVQSRELIRQTEKRIKRLGERSQEIGQVVGILQAISERTGILALNASMKAASAGEAGRSFAVVADEVKRLSESARESTARIARLVTSIQTEAHETVRAMNDAIGQVVAITRMADDAGQAMRRTQAETGSLVDDVRQIAATSEAQARISSGLQTRADVIRDASAETARQLRAQSIETRRLVEYARSLVEEVKVFRTPSRS